MRMQLNNADKITISHPVDIWLVMQRILKRENLIDRGKEHFWVIALSKRSKILNIELISIGSVSRVAVKPMDVLSIPLQKQAASLALVHNHPAGSLLPSEDDKDLTDLLIQACKLMSTPVFDHVIITEASFYSFRDMGLLAELEKSEKYVLPYELKARYQKEMLAVLKAERQQNRAKIQQSLEKGIRKGRKEGIQEGAKQREVAIAKQMLNKGLSIELIAQVTGLSEATISSLQK